MEPHVLAFKVPKKGYTEEEYEDAFEHSAEQRRFAIADGATESSFSDRWARSLVKQYIVDPPFGTPPSEDSMQLWLLPQQEEWRSGISWDTLPWFAEEKARSGAYAAFLGLEFGNTGTLWQKLLAKAMPGEDLTWHAFAIGDSCLFHIRENKLLKSFPVVKSEQFNSRPMLLASNPVSNAPALKEIPSIGGLCRPDDLFVLATDAIAKWFLEQTEAGLKPWQTLCALKSEAEFAILVEQLREKGKMRNDDTTIALVEWNLRPSWFSRHSP